MNHLSPLLGKFNNLEITKTKNVGCDIGGLYFNVEKNKEKRTENSLILHTKRRNINFVKRGNWSWLLTNIFFHPPFMQRCMDIIRTEGVGSVGSTGSAWTNYTSKENVAKFAELAKRYREKFGVNVNQEVFYAGSIFMCKRILLEDALSVVTEDLFLPGYAGDGRWQHALERFVPSSFIARGKDRRFVWW